MRAHATFPVLPGALVALSCYGGPASAPDQSEASYVPLVSYDAWSSVERSEDPFVTDPEQTPSCLGSGFILETGWVEIDTGQCSWVTLGAAARHAVAPGDGLRLVVSHYDLNAVEPAEGEARLWLGDCEAWSKSVPIPSAADFYTESFSSTCELEQGGLVRFHLHNHGQNNWQLRELSIQVPPP